MAFRQCRSILMPKRASTTPSPATNYRDKLGGRNVRVEFKVEARPAVVMAWNVGPCPDRAEAVAHGMRDFRGRCKRRAGMAEEPSRKGANQPPSGTRDGPVRWSKAMAKTDTQTVVRLSGEYAHRTSLRGGNPYRSKAYATAADSLAALSQPLDRVIAAGTLTDIPGIGDAIADIVTKLHQTGSHPSLEKLRGDVPEGVLELFAVPGVRRRRFRSSIRSLAFTDSRTSRRPRRRIAFARSKGLALRFKQKFFRTFPLRAAVRRSSTCTRRPLFWSTRLGP